MTTRFASWIAVFVVATLTIAASQADDGLAGTYRCTGTNPDGTRYEGVVQVVVEADRVGLRWTVGRSTYQGVGLRQGDTLAVLYDAGGFAGLAVYRIDDDTIDGRWVLPGAPGYGTETWTRLADVGAPI